MKKIISFMIVFSMLVTSIFGVDVVAESAESTDSEPVIDSTENGYSYYVTEEGVVIHSYWGREKNVVIPSNIYGVDVVGIANHAFAYGNTYDGIESIEIPNSVTSIGDYAFSGVKIKSMIIPNSVTSIGIGLFSGCQELQSVEIDNITSIKERMFCSCESLRSVILHDEIIEIGDYAFYNCKALKEFKSVESLKSIGDYAFYGCKNLMDFTAEKLESIGDYAFYGCTEYSYVYIPENLTEIGDYAFFGCNLYSIGVNKNNTVYDSRDNSCAVIKTDTNELILGSVKTKIPDTVERIKSFAFSMLTFYICDFYIPSSVKVIEEDAFYNCEFSFDLIVDEKNPVYDSRDNCNAIIHTKTNELILGCDTTVIPDSVSSIGMHAFMNGNLKKIIIPASVVSIGKEAFFGCEFLSEIDIPRTIINFGEDAFYGTKWLNNKKEEDSFVIVNRVLIDGKSCSGSINIPSVVIYIGDGAFANNELIKSITIQDGVKVIGENAFEGCFLHDIYIPKSVTSIGKGVFKRCYRLNSIIVDEENEKYDSRNECNAIVDTSSNVLMEGCNNTIIPETVVGISDYAFYGRSFTKILIPKSVTNIGDMVFYDNNNLEKLIVFETVTSIGKDLVSQNGEITICTVKDSYAEKYAKDYNLSVSYNTELNTPEPISTIIPTATPMITPTIKPTVKPTAKPTATPTVKPTAKPTRTPYTYKWWYPTYTVKPYSGATAATRSAATRSVIYINPNDYSSYDADSKEIIRVGKVYSFNHGLTGNVFYCSKNPQIASVDDDGMVTANRVGKTLIIAKNVFETYVCEVVVYKKKAFYAKKFFKYVRKHGKKQKNKRLVTIGVKTKDYYFIGQAAYNKKNKKMIISTLTTNKKGGCLAFTYSDSEGAREITKHLGITIRFPTQSKEIIGYSDIKCNYDSRYDCNFNQHYSNKHIDKSDFEELCYTSTDVLVIMFNKLLKKARVNIKKIGYENYSFD